MKRTVLMVSLCLVAGFSFAQKKVVKQAKSKMSETGVARDIIKPALTDPESATDPETWKVAGDIEFKSFQVQKEAEMLKEMTKKDPDYNVMYTGIDNMYDLYIKADELGELPDEKGKIKNKVRKDIAKNFKEAMPFYINGGLYYNDQQNFAKASEFFERYWDMPDLACFEGDNSFVKDSTFQTIKYYAVISAIQAKDSKRSIEILKKITTDEYIPTSAHAESDPYELLSVEYLNAGDTANFVATLKAGATKFPRNQYFTPNLINEYIKAGKADEALDYLDQAVKNDPENACELLSVKGSLFANDKKYAESKDVYSTALASDANCEKALEGLGVVYILQAQDVKEQAVQTTNKPKLDQIDKETIALYENALPLLEKYRKSLDARGADTEEVKSVLRKLQNVYYNLSLLNVDKNTELELIEKELGV